MQSNVTELDDNKVKLSVDVGGDAIDAAVDNAFRELAKEVRIPGFRPGKVPRKVLEARIGSGLARDQALRDSLPDYYAQAVRDNDIDVIAPPEIEITSGEDEGPVSFDAVVEVRPVIIVPGYDGIRVEVPSPEPTDDEIAEQIDRLRRQFAELETVERPGVDDDHMTIDITGVHDGDEVPGLCATDYDYLLGSGAVVDEIDENLRGKKAGDIVEFRAAHPDADEAGELEFRVLVKEVRTEVLPDVNDDFATEASEFDTIEELRADLAERLSEHKRSQTIAAARDKVSEALVELVLTDAPEPMVSSEMNQRLNDFGMRLQAQGIELDQYLEMTGSSSDEFVEELKTTATAAVKADLALRAVAEAESLEAGDGDYRAEIESIAHQMGAETETIAEQFADTDLDRQVRTDLRKRKAMEWLLEHSEIVDDQANAVDLATLQAQDDEADDDSADDDETSEGEETE